MIDIEVRHVRSFLAVAQELNITRAAARLHLTQQAVSTHIQQLERSLSVALLVRTSRGVLLTRAGDELAAGGKPVLDDLADLAVRVRAAADDQVGNVGLSHAIIRTDSRAVVLASDHRLADRSAVTLADLADDPVLRPDVLTSADAERFWLADPRPDGTPAPRGPAVKSMEDCLLEVARNRGVWLAPPQPLSRLVPPGNLRWIPVSDAAPFDLAMVWTDRASQSLIARMIAEVRTITGYRRLHAA